jgi:hypothetical protein
MRQGRPSQRLNSWQEVVQPRHGKRCPVESCAATTGVPAFSLCRRDPALPFMFIA